jgi:hypothetical protein
MPMGDVGFRSSTQPTNNFQVDLYFSSIAIKYLKWDFKYLIADLSIRLFKYHFVTISNTN